MTGISQLHDTPLTPQIQTQSYYFARWRQVTIKKKRERLLAESKREALSRIRSKYDRKSPREDSAVLPMPNVRQDLSFAWKRGFKPATSPMGIKTLNKSNKFTFREDKAGSALRTLEDKLKVEGGSSVVVLQPEEKVKFFEISTSPCRLHRMTKSHEVDVEPVILLLNPPSAKVDGSGSNKQGMTKTRKGKDRGGEKEMGKGSIDTETAVTPRSEKPKSPKFGYHNVESNSGVVIRIPVKSNGIAVPTTRRAHSPSRTVTLSHSDNAETKNGEATETM
jgi:hypothetical protein